MKATRKQFIHGLVASAMLLALPAPLRAHVVLEQRQAAVGAPYKAVLKVTHGCAGSATVLVTVTIPDGVIGVKPMPKPGWRVETTRGPYDRTYDFYHGTKLSEGVRQITWSGGRLEDAHYDEFVLSGVIADTLQVGGTIYFPVVQMRDAVDVMERCAGSALDVGVVLRETAHVPKPWRAVELPGFAPGREDRAAQKPTALGVDGASAGTSLRAERGGYVVWTAVLSVLLHAAIGIWLAVGAEPDSIGAGGVDLDAVSLEVIEASELLPAAVVSAPQEGNSDETREAIADLVPKPEIVLAIKPPEALLAPDPPSAEEPDVAAAPKQAQEVEAVPEEQPKEQPPEDTKPVNGTADIRQSGQDATAAGGLVTDTTAATAAAQAATSAAAGELRQYALAVRLAIGKARPRHTGARGKVVVVFTVGEDGRVEAPSVARSSGDARLDAEALAAIARATLPPPPAGATAQQRTFLIPFDFR